MLSHFKKSEPAVGAVKRVCRGHVKKALHCLRKAGRTPAVHEVRKEIKKSRAVLRLVREHDQDRVNRKVARTLRQAAHRLDGPRDAKVMLEELKKLAGARAPRLLQVHDALLKHSRQQKQQFYRRGSLAAARLLLRKAGKGARKLRVEASGWAAVEPGLKKTYDRGRMIFKLAGRQPSPEHFHNWRKQVKYLWYHLQMLCPDWPADTRRLTATLGRLGDQLGEDHDLYMLGQFVEQQASRAEARVLNDLIARRQTRLRAEALKLAQPVFAETPADLCRRLKRQWEAWRKQR